MKRATALTVTSLLMLTLGTGIAHAEPINDPPTTPREDCG